MHFFTPTHGRREKGRPGLAQGLTRVAEVVGEFDLFASQASSERRRGLHPPPKMIFDLRGIPHANLHYVTILPRFAAFLHF